MAERGNEGGLSPQTQAIIDRLQKEGNLLRNSGTNSIRSVKMDLEKFGSVFQTISTQLTQQTSYFASLDSRNEAMLEEQKRQADLRELEDNAPNPVAEEIAKLTEKADLLNAQTALRDAKEKAKGESVGIMGMLKSFLPSMSQMQNIALGGAGLFLGYNMVKGLIDGQTGGAWTQFEDSMIETFKSVDWNGVGQAFMDFAGKVPEALKAITEFISNPFGALVAGGALTAAMNPGIAAQLAAGGLRGGGGVRVPTTVPAGGQAPGGAGAKSMMSMRNMAFAAAGGAAVYYGQDIGDWIAKNGLDMSEDEIKNTPIDEAIGIGAAAAGGATIGKMFGPKGALVGAALGAVYGVGAKLHEIVTRTDLEDVDAVAVSERIANANADAANELLAQFEAGQIKLSEAQVEALRKQAIGPSQEMIQDTNDSIAENLKEAEEKLKNLQETGPQTSYETSTQVYNPETGMMERQRIDITDPQEIQRIQEEYNAELAEAQQVLKDLKSLGQARIEAGLATAEDLEYVDPVGWWERFKSVTGLEESSDRRARRQAELDAAREAGPGASVNVVVGGDTVNAVGGSTVVKQGDKAEVVQSTAIAGSGGNNDTGGLAL